VRNKKRELGAEAGVHTQWHNQDKLMEFLRTTEIWAPWSCVRHSFLTAHQDPDPSATPKPHTACLGT
jgi:hypothetical protein